tara:strand:- start:896 stop:1510 length:615 start_codon:yes stop_codon:yes gene_type:complete
MIKNINNMDDLENNADIRMGGDIIDETAQNSSLPKNMQPLYKSAVHKHGSSFTKTADAMAQKNYLDNNSDIKFAGDVIDQGVKGPMKTAPLYNRENLMSGYSTSLMKTGQETNKHQSTPETKLNPNPIGFDLKPDKGAYFEAIKTQNDSLKALPVNNLNHLPNFDITTNEGQAAKTKFYTQDGNNEKLRRFQALDQNLRSQFGL